MSRANLIDWVSQVRGEGAIDMRLQLREIDLNHPVVWSTFVRSQQVGVLVSEVGDVLPASGSQVVVHTLVVGEDGGGGSYTRR